MSKPTARRSSVASFRYTAVDAVDLCPRTSPMVFRGTAAQQTDRSCMTKGVGALPATRSDSGHLQTSADDTVKDRPAFICLIGRPDLQKSEEHTSELQSLR